MGPSYMEKPMAGDINFLANTTFYSDKDNINPKPLDAYGTSDNIVYNKIEKWNEKLGIDPSGLMRGYKWVKENLPIMRSIYKNGKAVINGGNWATRMAAASGLFKDSFPFISSKLPDGMAETIASKFDENQNLFVKIGQTADMVEGTDFKNLNQIGNLIGNLSGSGGLFEIEDRACLTAVMTGLAIEGCRAGVPGVLNSLIRSTDNRAVLQGFITEAFPDLLKLGDVEIIRDLADICEDQGFTIERLGSVENILYNVNMLKENPEQILSLFNGGRDILNTYNYGQDFVREIAGDINTPVVWTPNYYGYDTMSAINTGIINGGIDPIYACTLTGLNPSSYYDIQPTGNNNNVTTPPNSVNKPTTPNSIPSTTTEKTKSPIVIREGFLGTIDKIRAQQADFSEVEVNTPTGTTTTSKSASGPVIATDNNYLNSPLDTVSERFNAANTGSGIKANRLN